MRCLVLVAIFMVACAPTLPDGRLACEVGADCPPGFTCALSDRRCHRGLALDASLDAQGADAALDASALDASPDASTAADAMADAGRRCGGAAECNDMNPCTIDLCIGNACTYGLQDDGFACDDGVHCNGADACVAGTCEHAGDPCAPGTCDEANDWCACDDGNACTAGDHLTATGCAGDPAAAHHTLCGACDGSGCRMCCNGTCRNVNENAFCAGCDSPCSGSESCRFSATRACGWLWCCST